MQFKQLKKKKSIYLYSNYLHVPLIRISGEG